MGHEFHGEDIGSVSGTDAGLEGERLVSVVRIVFPDIQVGVVGSGRKKTSTCRPATLRQLPLRLSSKSKENDST